MSKPILEVQPPPNAVLIELSEGCSIQCKFCGIAGIREKPGGYNHMTMDTATCVATGLLAAKSAWGWNPRIEFSMHGEPTTNRNAVKIITLLRRMLPSTSMMMLSNGSGLAGGNTVKKIEDLFNAGLNTLAIEQYGHAPFHKIIKEKYRGHPDPLYYPAIKEANPHTRQKPGTRRFIYVADIFTETKGNHSSINTHCGLGSPPVDTHIHRRCGKPFREFSVRWDGKVSLCCNDWRGYYYCGDITQESFYTVWQGKEFNAARKELVVGNRDKFPNVCAGCNEVTHREGLLPDKLGKMRMADPTHGSRKRIKAILSQPPLSAVVERPWEDGTE